MGGDRGVAGGQDAACVRRAVAGAFRAFRQKGRREPGVTVPIADDLVDEMCLTISPTLAGESTTSRRNAHLGLPARFSLRHAVAEDDYVYLRYGRKRP